MKKLKIVGYENISIKKYNKKIKEFLSKAIGFDEFYRPIFKNKKISKQYEEFVNKHKPIIKEVDGNTSRCVQDDPGFI